MTITLDELLDALGQSTTAPDDARTVSEICAEFDLPVRRVRDALRALQAQGRLGVHTVTRMDLSGRTQRVPAYTIAPKA